MKHAGPLRARLALWLTLSAPGVVWASEPGSAADDRGSVFEDDWGDEDRSQKARPPAKDKGKPADAPKTPPPGKDKSAGKDEGQGTAAGSNGTGSSGGGGGAGSSGGGAGGAGGAGSSGGGAGSSGGGAAKAQPSGPFEADDDEPVAPPPPRRAPPPSARPPLAAPPTKPKTLGQPAVFEEDDDVVPEKPAAGPAEAKGEGGAKAEGGAKGEGGARGEGGAKGEAPAEGGGAPQLKMRYHGVAPGRAELPPNVAKRPSAQGPHQMTWPGFQVKGGQATVFFQLSGPVEYSVSEDRGEVSLTLHDTVVSSRNNLRPLLVGEFKTPVQSVRIDSQRKKKVVRVSVMVKGQVAHRERLEQGENGYSMLIMEIGPLAATARP